MVCELESQQLIVDPFVGRLVADKFLIEAFVGGGSMGHVYRALHTGLGKTVAIKVIHPEHAHSEAFSRRLRHEAQAASRFEHPNLVRVLDFGEDAGLLYIVMEYVDGRELSEVLARDAPFGVERIVNIMSQILSGLAIAHDGGIVHRDLKPENIMILEGRTEDGAPADLVKVYDFGIAQEFDILVEGGEVRQRTASEPGLVIGTPAYMSPEQARGESLDGRSDVYAAGVILFELLCGHIPFDAESEIDMLLAHANRAPPLPSSFGGDVDPALEAICLRALSKKADDRFATAREMRHALRDVVANAQPKTMPFHSIAPRALASPPEGILFTDESPTVRGDQWHFSVGALCATLRVKYAPSSGTLQAGESELLQFARAVSAPRGKRYWGHGLVLLAILLSAANAALLVGRERVAPPLALPTTTHVASVPTVVSTSPTPPLSSAHSSPLLVAVERTRAQAAALFLPTRRASPRRAAGAAAQSPSPSPPTSLSPFPSATAGTPTERPAQSDADTALDTNYPRATATRPLETGPTFEVFRVQRAAARETPPASTGGRLDVHLEAIGANGARPNAVRHAVALEPLQRCFRAARSVEPSLRTVAIHAHIDFDIDGRTVAATVSGPDDAREMTFCVHEALRRVVLSGVDTGAPSADFVVRFAAP